MLSRTIRAARPVMASISRPAARRSIFTPTSIRAADFVQSLYLKELANTKIAQPKAGDADSHVSKFSIPKAPKSPEEDISSQLSTYESQAVDVEGSASSESGAPAVEEDWFEEEEEEEGEAHH